VQQKGKAMKQLGISVAIACGFIIPTALDAQSVFPKRMVPEASMGSEIGTEATAAVHLYSVPQIPEFGISRNLAGIASTAFSEQALTTRSARDVAIYKNISPSVVLIATDSGLGSGSLIDQSGNIITNLHVIKGFSVVNVVFKPAKEGKIPDREEIRRGRVVKIDEIADLALVKVDDLPAGRQPVTLGDITDIAVGSDVHAIGHPTGEAWTYTNGVISQFRMAYQWHVAKDSTRHKADVIQTQTPINPGNSGGPLLSDSGQLLGINTFKSDGEGLNFAVSVEDVKAFLARQDNRMVAANPATAKTDTCKTREVYKGRMKDGSGSMVALDTRCTGKVDVEFIYPDDTRQPYIVKVDRNLDGRADGYVFDFARKGKWQWSQWDNGYDGDFEGPDDVVGFHPNGDIRPSSYESFAAFKAQQTAEK
jgi:S1-C subfamily serine protease